jgi:hypothetical protein
VCGESGESRGGGTSILFRIYEPLQTTANTNNNTNPYPSASLAVRLSLWPCWPAGKAGLRLRFAYVGAVARTCMGRAAAGTITIKKCLEIPCSCISHIYIDTCFGGGERSTRATRQGCRVRRKRGGCTADPTNVLCFAMPSITTHSTRELNNR